LIKLYNNLNILIKLKLIIIYMVFVSYIVFTINHRYENHKKLSKRIENRKQPENNNRNLKTK